MLPETITPAFRVEFPHNPATDQAGLRQTEDLLAAVRENVRNYRRFRLTFREPVSLQRNSRKKTTVTEAVVKLFVNQHVGLCYTFHSRTGYPLSFVEHAIATVEGVAADSDKEKTNHIEAIRKLASRIHPNAWDDLREDCLSRPESLLDHRPGCISMSSILSQHVIQELEKAFEYKIPYHYDKSGKQRDHRVEVALQKNGCVAAWFSSEFAGCGNGTYYLLINPNTATFAQDD